MRVAVSALGSSRRQRVVRAFGAYHGLAMQLFAIACRLPDDDDAAVGQAVRRVGCTVLELDAATMCEGRSASGELTFATLGHSPTVAGRRRYQARRGDVIVVFNGLPIEKEGRFEAHDAMTLLEHWDVLDDRLEGIFSAVRIDLSSDKVECLLDVLGMAPTFVARKGRGWIVSNSVAVIRSVTGRGSPDPLGVSSLLSMGWPAGGRTLVAGVTRLEGGSKYALTPQEWRVRSLFSPAMVAPRVNPRDITGIDDLANRLKATTAAAARSVVPVRCPLTAGRDSRVILALLRSAGAESVRYYTSGVEADTDVRVARTLAAQLGLPHELVTPTVPGRSADWTALTSRFVSQTDGMANLFAIADHMDHDGPVERLGLNLFGPGGEIARAGRVGLLVPFAANTLGLRSSSRVQRMVLQAKLGRAEGMVTPSAIDTARAHIEDFADTRQAEGWRPREILEAYYAFERVRYWAATGVQRLARATDAYSPFVSRAFISYAFSLSPGERYMEAAHYDLLSVLSPGLRDIPFDVRWRPQQAWRTPFQAPADVVKAAATRLARDRLPVPGRRSRGAPTVDGLAMSFGQRWFEAGLRTHRDVCLSSEHSPLWAFVDRRRLESALASSPHERAPGMGVLCAVVTAFWYFHGPGST